jgi:hypothetical protein
VEIEENEMSGPGGTHGEERTQCSGLDNWTIDASYKA